MYIKLVKDEDYVLVWKGSHEEKVWREAGWLEEDEETPVEKPEETPVEKSEAPAKKKSI